MLYKSIHITIVTRVINHYFLSEVKYRFIYMINLLQKKEAPCMINNMEKCSIDYELRTRTVELI